jgi:hypothetical protein
MVYGLTLLPCFELQSRPTHQISWLFCDFPQSLQANVRYLKIIPRLLPPSTYFQTHHSNHSNIVRQQTTQSTNKHHTKQQNKISLKHDKAVLQFRQSDSGFLVWKSKLNLKFFHIRILMNKAAIKQVSLFSFLLPIHSATTPYSINTISEICGGSN